MLPSQPPSMNEWLQRLGSLPWLAQPGERWMYHVSGDALGALIARVSGQTLGKFMRERIFDPLGMKDTAFHVPPEKIDRLPGFYSFNQQSQQLDLFDDPASSAWRTEPAFELGGGGLASTMRPRSCSSVRAAVWRRAHSIACHSGTDDFRSSHSWATRRLGAFLWYILQLGIGDGGRH